MKRQLCLYVLLSLASLLGTPGKFWVHDKVEVDVELIMINNVLTAEHPLQLHVQSVS